MNELQFKEQLNTYSKEILIEYIHRNTYSNEQRKRVIAELKYHKDNINFRKKCDKEDQLWNIYEKASKEYLDFIKYLQNKYNAKEVKFGQMTNEEILKLTSLNDKQQKAFNKWCEATKSK